MVLEVRLFSYSLSCRAWGPQAPKGEGRLKIALDPSSEPLRMSSWASFTVFLSLGNLNAVLGFE